MDVTRKGDQVVMTAQEFKVLRYFLQNPERVISREGTALGLAIVQKICEDHGGRATLEKSELGHTVFCMTLPQRGERSTD